MSAVCQVTGRKPGYGKRISHSHRRTSRRWLPNVLRMFISDRGKIRSRRVTGLSPQQQRRVATAIKNAREMALLTYPGPAKPGPAR